MFPFMSFEFLWGLEVTRCVGGETGWEPRYLVVEVEGVVWGAVAVYKKTNSQGEFIFDWAWADAAYRIGLPYYPKLTVSVPFSPVTGPRFLIAEVASSYAQEVREALIGALRQLAIDESASGLHLLFITPKEEALCHERGLLIRHTTQFQWCNKEYQSFDHFLEQFRSKRRNQIKRERARLREAGVVVRAIIGDELTSENIEQAYGFYRATVDKYFHGNLYLNQAFFKHLYVHLRSALVMIVAEREGLMIGGSFNLLDAQQGVLFGRYWGCAEDVEVPNLHFEVCSYAGIELCIERGWDRFEAGSGGAGHKFGRGFLPKVIRSAHEVYLPGFNPVLSQFLNDERAHLSDQLSQLEGKVLKGQ